MTNLFRMSFQNRLYSTKRQNLNIITLSLPESLDKYSQIKPIPFAGTLVPSLYIYKSIIGWILYLHNVLGTIWLNRLRDS